MRRVAFQPPRAPSITLSLEVHDSPHSKGSRGLRVALLAHPYGRLGGSSQDATVQSLARCLSAGCWTVVAYDARGVGDSTGRQSWTGVGEAQDYQDIVDGYIADIIKGKLQTDHESLHVELLLAGYSYGSMAASVCRPPHFDTELAGRVTVNTRYLLLSYPLSVLSWLTCFKPFYFRNELETLVSSSTTTPFLIVYGNRDQFTSIGKYQSWSKQLKTCSNKISVQEVEGADHFWNGRRQQLCQLVTKWIETTSIPTPQ